MKKSTLHTVAEYLAEFPPATRKRMEQIRKTILQHAPGVEESISYGMPAYKLYKKPLVYFAGYEHHIGFYATPAANAALAEKTRSYKQGKGSIQFPLDEPLPLDLVAELVDYKVNELTEKYGVKKT